MLRCSEVGLTFQGRAELAKLGQARPAGLKDDNTPGSQVFWFCRNRPMPV